MATTRRGGHVNRGKPSQKKAIDVAKRVHERSKKRSSAAAAKRKKARQFR